MVVLITLLSPIVFIKYVWSLYIQTSKYEK